MSRIKNQRVPRSERMLVDLTIDLPDINKNRRYTSTRRSYLIFFDDELRKKIDQTCFHKVNFPVRLRTLITIKKVFAGDPEPDSTFSYRVGENFAILKNKSRYIKRVAIDFNESNLLKVLTDNEFATTIDIS